MSSLDPPFYEPEKAPAPAAPPEAPRNSPPPRVSLAANGEEAAQVPCVLPVGAPSPYDPSIPEVLPVSELSPHDLSLPEVAALPGVPLRGPLTDSVPALRPAPDWFTATLGRVFGVDRRPHPTFLSAVLWCLAFLIVLYAVLIGIGIVGLFVVAALSPNPKGVLSGMMQDGKPSETFLLVLGYASLIAEVASILMAWAVVRLIVGQDWKRRLALRPPGVVHVLLVLLSFPCMLFLPTLLHILAQKYLHLPSLGDTSKSGEMFAGWPLWLSILAVGVGPGIGEELWCRGFLGRGLVGRYGWVSGVVLTSLLFGLLHVDPAYAVATMSMGIWLHYVYLTSRSLPLSMFLHFLNNTVAVLEMKYLAGAGADVNPLGGPALVAYVGTAVLLGATAYALFQSRARLAPVGEGPPLWQPPWPGVSEPPPGSGLRVLRPWPSALACLVMVAGIGFFVLCLVYFYRQTGQWIF